MHLWILFSTGLSFEELALRSNDMSNDTNLIDFLHDQYSNGSNCDMAQTHARLQQHLEQQRKLVLNEIATVKKEEEQLKSLAQPTNVHQSVFNLPLTDASAAMDIEQINKLPLDL